MRYSPSPLRYPGGKTQLFPLVCRILQINDLYGGTYIEPFAGGAGLALSLLLKGIVSRIIINDLDPHIYAFWHSVICHSDDLCSLIDSTEINCNNWQYQKLIYRTCDLKDPIRLGFATLFLNRTNVSGILTGGMIGGKDQKGTYKLDARFNKQAIKEKIHAIADMRAYISLFNEDAICFMKQRRILNLKKAFFNFDPPYVEKGARLYQNFYKESDHQSLSKVILGCRAKWIATYDMCPLIQELYAPCRQGNINVFYSAATPRLAREVIIFSQNLQIPEVL